MTALERSQKKVINLLILERDAANERAGRYLEIATLAAREPDASATPKRKARHYRCVYCGQSVLNGHLACPKHRDLLELDPLYTRLEEMVA